MRVAGADGCKAGWIVVSGDLDYRNCRVALFEKLEMAFESQHPPAKLAVDMPIGFLNQAREGGRECERALRKILIGKASSVFSAPCRRALLARTHEEASRINRENSEADGKPVGLSQQAFGLFKKMNEVDALLLKLDSVYIYECHPEYSFALMGNEIDPIPILESKKTLGGIAKRVARLRKSGINLDNEWRSLFRASAAQPDDILDAFACYWSAVRIAKNSHKRLPPSPEVDAQGRIMAIHG
jgi:predicted RNase H-like nuclease